MIQEFLILCLITIGLAAIAKSFLPKLPNNIKYIIFSFSVLFTTMIPLPIMLLRPKYYGNIIMTLWLLEKVSSALGVTMEVRGAENINKARGNVTILNHQSNYDCLAAWHIWPKIGRATTVCKKELLYVPFFGLATWLSGFIFIDRSKRSKSIEILHQQADVVKKNNSKILIFPEGTRSLKDKLLRFKKGAFHIALEAKCPIQPVVISSCKFAKGNEISEKNHAIVSFLPEIDTTSYNNDNIDELIKLCYDTMQKEYDNLNIELKSKNL